MEPTRSKNNILASIRMVVPILKGGYRIIRAMIFDLDGTLVQTEKLKALSYAKAAREL